MHIPEELNTQSGADQILMLSSPSKKNKKNSDGTGALKKKQSQVKANQYIFLSGITIAKFIILSV